MIAPRRSEDVRITEWHPTELGWQRRADGVWESPRGELRIFPPGQSPIIQRFDDAHGTAFLTLGDLVKE